MVSTQNPFVANSTESDDQSPEVNLKTLLVNYSNGHHQENSMDRGAPEYSQSGLQSPYQTAFNDAQSEGTSADNSSAAQYPGQQEVPSNTYSTSATPTSDYAVYPTSARSSSFPEHIHQGRRYHPASNHSGSSGGMAQPQSPSMPLQDGRANHQNQMKSDQDVPIDPSIAASSPTYPHGQYSPYPPQQEMQHGYPAHPGTMYAQPRPDWGVYGGQHHGMPAPYQTSGVSTPTSAAPAGIRGPPHPLAHQQQIYSFVPIPGAQQHKRPRRRYEEIERMYKCGWNGCEKAYGTLNHLNAHVTMQSHGQKRTPEEFKEIRKEWKAKKKEDENNRKALEERERGPASQNGGPPSGSGDDSAPPSAGYQPRSQVQLPPIGYQPGAQVPGQYQPASNSVQQLQEYGHPTTNAISYSGYPASPYGQGPQMYNNQSNGNGTGPKYEQ